MTIGTGASSSHNAEASQSSKGKEPLAFAKTVDEQKLRKGFGEVFYSDFNAFKSDGIDDLTALRLTIHKTGPALKHMQYLSHYNEAQLQEAQADLHSILKNHKS